MRTVNDWLTRPSGPSWWETPKPPSPTTQVVPPFAAPQPIPAPVMQIVPPYAAPQRVAPVSPAQAPAVTAALPPVPAVTAAPALTGEPPVAAPAAPVATPGPPAPGPAPAPAIDQAAMSQAAGQIFAAADGMGTDENSILSALRGRSPAEIAAIKAEYQNHYGTSLESVLTDELDGDDLASATAAMSADPVQAAAATLVRASNGVGTDEEAIQSTLRGITDPAVRAQVEAEYTRRTGATLSGMLEDELGGTDADVAIALTSGNTDEADAILIDDAMSGMGTDEDAINKVLEDCADQAQRDRVIAAYQLRTGRSLQTDMADEMSGTDLSLSGALSTGDAAGAAAVRIQAAASGLGTDEDAIFQQLQVADPSQRQAIIDAYNGRFGGATGMNLEQMLADELGAMDGERATQLTANGQLDPVFALRYAMDGVGTDEDMLRGALSGLDPTQAAQLQADYAARYGGNLQDQMSSELSGRDEFYISQGLGGERGLSTDERLSRADAAHDFERGSGAGIFGGFTDVFFDAGEQLDAQHDRLGTLRQQRDGAATPEARIATEREIDRVLGYQGQDQDAYHAAQDSVTNGAATGAAIVATVAVTAATGGLGAGAAVPALAAFMGSAGAATGIGATSLAMGAGALAGGLTSMAVKRSISGDAYGAEAAGLDLAMTGVNAVTAGAMSSGALTQGLPSLLAQRGVGTFAPAVGGSFTNTLATQVVQGGVGGLVSGTTQGLLDERTWRGPGNGVGNFLTTVAGSMASNMGGGAVQTLAGGAAQRLNMFDPNTVAGSVGTGVIGGMGGAAGQTALTADTYDGNIEDVALRFGSSMGTGGLQGGMTSGIQSVSAQRLAAQSVALAPAPATPVANPADQIPQAVVAGLPEEVQAVVVQAQEHPPGSGPQETESPVNPAALAALSPELPAIVEAANPLAQTADVATPAAETPTPIAPVVESAPPAPLTLEELPELLVQQDQARVDPDVLEALLVTSPEARAAADDMLTVPVEGDPRAPEQ